MRRDSWFLVFAIFLTFLLVILNSFSEFWVYRVFSRVSGQEIGERERLRLENERLRAENAVLSQFKDSPASAGEITASVFSRYPFNLKSELTVDKGSADGVKEGSAAVYNGILLGKIREVFGSTSVVQTVFDARMEFAVRIGSSGVEALLSGKEEPRISLIPKNSGVKEGDPVYAADTSLPFGLPLGSMKNFRTNQNDPFGEAELALPYSLKDVKIIHIK